MIVNCTQFWTYGVGIYLSNQYNLKFACVYTLQFMSTNIFQVTLVDNLECYGISPVDFAHSMQKLAAASTTS